MYQTLIRAAFFIPILVFLSYLVFEQKLSYTYAGIIFLIFTITILTIFRLQNKESSKAPFEIKRSSSLFINIMENLTDPFLLLDKEKNTMMANKSAVHMFGGQIVNQPVSEYIYDVEVLLAINKAIDTGKSDTVEFMMSNPRPRNYLLRIHVLENSQNDKNEFPINFIIDGRTVFITIYDITSIREAERMRVDFVANVSHELRTPLASILGFIETLQGPAQGDVKTLTRFLKIMQDEAGRMTRLIEDLLSLSHIERDAHIPPSGKVSLFHIISSVIETLNIRLADRYMTTSFTHDEDVPKITGDADQLTQVFQNLIDNAIKYGAEHTNITVHLRSMINEKNNKKYVEVTVKNLGTGIAEEHLERLTERFYRVDTARSRSMGGTGLGLAIVKHIIQRHEGRLNIKSEFGQSTTVIVQLPVEI